MSDPKTTVEQAAELLCAAGWQVVPPVAPPDEIAVGARVRYRRSMEYGPDQGDMGTITKVRQPDGGWLDKVRVFWVKPDNWPNASIYTTPDDAEVLSQ